MSPKRKPYSGQVSVIFLINTKKEEQEEEGRLLCKLSVKSSYIPSFISRESVKDTVVEVNELLEHVLAGPGDVTSIILVGKTTLSEVNRDADGTSSKAVADVFLYLIANVIQKLVSRVVRDLTLQGV